MAKQNTKEIEKKILEEEQAKGNTLGSRLITDDENNGVGGQLVFGERDESGQRQEVFSRNTNVPKVSVDDIPKTINDNADSFKVNEDASKNASAFGNGQTGEGAGSAFSADAGQSDQLSPERQAVFDAELKGSIDQLTADAEADIAAIKDKGKQRIGGATAFLAKTGALGRTISGAPINTNLGVLDTQQNLIDAAVKEEYDNLAREIAAAKAGNAGAVQAKIDELNKFAQTNFDNAFKLIQEDRALRAEDRADMLADLKVHEFGFKIEKAGRELTSENAKDAMGTIKVMAESGAPLTAISLDLAADLEAKAGLPSGIFASYYQSLQDAKNLETAENMLKVEKIEAEIFEKFAGIENDQRRTEIAQQQANTSAFSASVSAGNLSLRKQELDQKLTETNNKDEKEFYTNVQTGQDDLLKGKNWGQVWNTLFSQYATGDSTQDKALGEMLDESLDKDFWSRDEAYQEFKKSTSSGLTQVFVPTQESS